LHFGFDKEKIIEIEHMISKREKARLKKDWKESDAIRLELESLGVELEDNQTSTLWSFK